MIRILLLFFLLLPSHLLLAQRYYPSGFLSREQLGFGMGTSTYFGDLQEEGYFASTLHFMLNYEYQLHPHWSLKADGVIYQLKASDANSNDAGRMIRNLSFHSTNVELSSSLLFYLFRKLPTDYTQRPSVNIYGQIGLGATYFNPKNIYHGTAYSLRDLQTEGVAYSKVTAVIPMGIGVQFRATDKLDITFETSYRYAFSDYLDDVSTKYQDQSAFQSEIAAALSDPRQELGKKPAAAGSQRGNPTVKDGYGLYSLRLSYYLNGPYYQAKDRKQKWKR